MALTRAFATGYAGAPSALDLRRARDRTTRRAGESWKYPPPVMRAVARAHQAAKRAGRPEGAAVVEALAKAGVPASPGAARQLVLKLRKTVDPKTGKTYLPPST